MTFFSPGCILGGMDSTDTLIDIPTPLDLPVGTTRRRGEPFSDDALAAVEQAKLYADKMVEVRELLSVLAEHRADAIRQALAAGMNQADVARALGINCSAVNNALRQH